MTQKEWKFLVRERLFKIEKQIDQQSKLDGYLMNIYERKCNSLDNKSCSTLSNENRNFEKLTKKMDQLLLTQVA